MPSFFGQSIAAVARFANRHGVYMGKRSARLHVAVYRRSAGRIGGHLPGWPEAPIALVDHVGAKSDIRRTSPLIYRPDGDSIAVVASKGGQATNPAWFHNLMAQSVTTIQIGSEIRQVSVRIAGDAERNRLWADFVAFFPSYEFFQANAGGREIPIVIFESLNLRMPRHRSLKTRLPRHGDPPLQTDRRITVPYQRALPYVDPEKPQGLFHRAIARLVNTRAMVSLEGSLLYQLTTWRVVPILMRLTGGRFAGLLPVPVGVIDTRDARNGSRHRRAVVYFHDGNRVIVTPSKAGLADHPYWYQNVVADPDVFFEEQPYRAEVVEDTASQVRLWALADHIHGASAIYRERAAKFGRVIPILQLTPPG
jgi:deazaflavin-dependent oxidoreductase (nitroreductase family)